MSQARLPEPWLRATHTDVPPVLRAVLHALDLAKEDLEKWCGDLSDNELNAGPFGLAPVAFHIQHIARSIDRLLTYAEGKELAAEQLGALRTELDPGATRDAIFKELAAALTKSAERIRAFNSESLNESRNVGRNRLPTTVAGLLVHIADHTQRHVGQAITTAKAVRAHS
jgi:uncharacterized damage-inducible protein DinB